ncbi:dTDP-4-dehydrorhamnose 3,5-epimerase [Agrobacterium pusense]|uniref:dTDP-4-dehydrorhamnose 3,5-epimerase n=1 Tax=Agrobacterium pusense TaxID=648995 RepID=UPI0028667E32|nr:dTDP-4-dehydrorhamnose 3,5-epimerase [Agrobacterium pusense]MDR6192723.1 dTDP-4-dehydrorhamnose 3,5-epimerase [Agrobacterium pusense]
MEFEKLMIEEVQLITPKKIGDDRGYFMENFRHDLFRDHLGDYTFVQENQSLSAKRCTVRGLHYQREPKAQGKLVRCVAGAIFDVAVDIRTGSPTYGRHVSAELSQENGQLLWIPPGFAHGFCTLRDNSIVCYKTTDYYSAAHDSGLCWDDPDLAIGWPVDISKAILSDKDRVQPYFAELDGNVFSVGDKAEGLA